MKNDSKGRNGQRKKQKKWKVWKDSKSCKSSSKKQVLLTTALMTVWIMLLSGCAAFDGTQKEQSGPQTGTADENTGDLTGGGQSITDIDNGDQSITGVDNGGQPSAAASQDLDSMTEDVKTSAGSQDVAATDNQPGDDTAQTEITAEPDTTDTAAATGTLYEQFLRNEVSAAVSSSFPEADYPNPVIEKGKSYTLAELKERISSYFLDPEFSNKTDCDYVQYAYVNSADSTGARQLLVKFVGLNIYAPDDDSYAVVVISENSGQLYVTAEFECWARSATSIYSNGVIDSYGSSGAGDHMGGTDILMSDGTVASVYYVEELAGQWTGSVNQTLYSEVFGTDTDPGNFIVAICTVGEEKYYRYDMSECTEEQKVLCETYVNRCRDEQGIIWITEDEVLGAVKERCAILGISYETIQQKPEPVWNNVE